MLVAVIAVDLGAVASSFAELSLLDRWRPASRSPMWSSTATTLRQGAVGLVQAALLVAAAVMFIRWLRLCYRNTDVIAPGLRRYGHALGDRCLVRAVPQPLAPEADRQRRLARRRELRVAALRSDTSALSGKLGARRGVERSTVDVRRRLTDAAGWIAGSGTRRREHRSSLDVAGIAS